jgi:hypothetical protein
MNEELGMLLSNIQSLLTEIGQALGIGQAPAQPEAPEIQEAAKQEGEEEEKDPNEMQKTLDQTQSEGVTANDSAEERADEAASDTTEENVDDVAKALAVILKQKMDKKDSAKPKIQKSNDNEVLAEMTKVLKQLANNQNEMQQKQSDTETAIMNILKGLKIADEVEKSIQPENKGLNNPKDNEQVANLLKALSQGKDKKEEDTDSPYKRSEYVQKKLRNPDILKALTGVTK